MKDDKPFSSWELQLLFGDSNLFWTAATSAEQLLEWAASVRPQSSEPETLWLLATSESLMDGDEWWFKDDSNGCGGKGDNKLPNVDNDDG